MITSKCKTLQIKSLAQKVPGDEQNGLQNFAAKTNVPLLNTMLVHLQLISSRVCLRESSWQLYK